VPDRAMGDHRRLALFRVLRPRQPGAAGRPVLERCRRQSSRAHPLAGPGRQALSDDRSRSPDCAADGELHHPGGHRRGAIRLDQRRRADECAERRC
jgi:hypothetical protein